MTERTATSDPEGKSVWKRLGIYLVSAALSLLILAIVMQLWRADLRVPLAYSGDAMFYHVITKGMIDHGWFEKNPSIGLPTGMDLRDVPTSDHNFFLLFLKLISLFTSNYALVVNLFFLAGFPLTAMSALFVFRRFGVSIAPAFIGSQIYTFLPFHFSRGENHLFLAAYYLVPLVAMVILWVCDESPAPAEAKISRLKTLLRDYRFVAALVICALVGSTGTYYAFFSCFLLLVAGGLVAIRRRRLSPFLLPLIFIGVIGTVTVVNLLPSMIYLARNGDTSIVRRNPADADTYGFKLAQLLLPISGHRIYRVSQFKGVYNLRPSVNENDDSSLGAIGSLGFLALLGWFLYKKADHSLLQERGVGGLFHHLSLLSIAGVLLATIGGFGSLFALIISPKIRAYNRIGIFLGFFAIFAIVLLLDETSRRYFSSRGQGIVFNLGLLLTLVVGVFDQTSVRFIPNYAQIKAEHQQDAAFVQGIESTLPPGASIFQLPVVSFPENPKVNKMNDYDLAKGYLHSKRLQWSYGAIKGREGDVWQKLAAAKPAPELVETIALAGFSGLYLDRFGYQDNGDRLIAELAEITGAQRITSANDRLAFFDLSEYARKLREKYQGADWEVRKEAVLHPLLILWQNGFSEVESNGENSWRWCADEGRLEIVNGARQARRVKLEMTLAAGRDANLKITSGLFSEQLRINLAGVDLKKDLVIPPGRHMIKFYCDAPRVLAPLDSRVIVFRVQNYKLSLAE